MEANLLEAYRKELLAAAEADVIKWCGPHDQKIGRNQPDTHWLMLFQGRYGGPVTAEQAHRFLVTFQLTMFRTWNVDAAAEAIRDTSEASEFTPLTAIPALSARLAPLVERSTQETSAASKIATFAQPTTRVYIWDKLATRSARYRDWVRSGGTGRKKLGSLFVHEGRHDYPAYYAACDRAMEDERERPDFIAARDRLIARFRAGDGIMSEAAIATDDFIERRLLDKLMFAEGNLLRRKKGGNDGNDGAPILLAA